MRLINSPASLARVWLYENEEDPQIPKNKLRKEKKNYSTAKGSGSDEINECSRKSRMAFTKH